MPGLALQLLCSSYAPASRPVVGSRRCDAPRCSVIPDLAAAPLDALAATPLVSDLAAAPHLAVNPAVFGLVGASALGAAAWSATRPQVPIGAPYPADAKAYDPDKADTFYGARLPLVASRLLRLGALTFAFNLRLALDYFAYKRAGSPEDEPWPNEKDRAKEALGLATQLGPTFIKLAQALSIRTDLIPEVSARRRPPARARSQVPTTHGPTPPPPAVTAAAPHRRTRWSCGSCRTPCPPSTPTTRARSSLASLRCLAARRAGWSKAPPKPARGRRAARPPGPSSGRCSCSLLPERRLSSWSKLAAASAARLRPPHGGGLCRAHAIHGQAGLSSIFAALSPEPLAAASIGQVYKGVLRDGREVAVKVQRPQILDDIALDLYLLRILTPLQTRASAG